MIQVVGVECHGSVVNDHQDYYLRQVMDEREQLYHPIYQPDENPEDDINLRDAKADAAFVRVEKSADYLEPLEHLFKTLSKKDYLLLDSFLDGMTMAEIAEKLGDTEDATESRWRRLKTRLGEKIRENRDGK